MRFIKSVTGLIARFVNKAERGKAKNQNESKTSTDSKPKFWDARPFSRIVYFGKDFKKVKSYFFRNTLEALGWVQYQTRKVVKDTKWRNFWIDYCYSEIRI